MIRCAVGWWRGGAAFVLVLVLMGLGSRVLGAQRAAATVFESVTVIDVVAGELRAHQRVVVVGCRIQAVGPVDSVPRPAHARLVHAAGQYLIPGLWDMHTHIKWFPDLAYRLLIANRITGVRDPGDEVTPLATRRRWQRVGPRLLMTGDVVSPRDAAADFVKNYMTNGSDSEPATFFALAAEARRVELWLEGHLFDQISLEQASDSGQRIIDHQLGVGRCCTLSPERHQFAGVGDTVTATLETCQALAQYLRRNGTWLVPTLSHGFVRPTYPGSTSPRARGPSSNTWGRRPMCCPATRWR